MINACDERLGVGERLRQFDQWFIRVLLRIETVHGIGQLTSGDAAVENSGELIDVCPWSDRPKLIGSLLNGRKII